MWLTDTTPSSKQELSFHLLQMNWHPLHLNQITYKKKLYYCKMWSTGTAIADMWWVMTSWGNGGLPAIFSRCYTSGGLTICSMIAQKEDHCHQVHLRTGMLWITLQWKQNSCHKPPRSVGLLPAKSNIIDTCGKASLEVTKGKECFTIKIQLLVSMTH